MISKEFKVFMTETPEVQQVWGEMIKELSLLNTLTDKERTLCYISALTASETSSGLPYHIHYAKQIGITKKEIISSVLLSLPLIGAKTLQSLTIALEAFDTD